MNSLQHELSDKIWQNISFQNEMSTLYFAHVYKSFSHEIQAPLPDAEAIIRLLKAAAILSLSKNPEHRKAAYRIAISSFRLFSKEYENIHNILHVILARLGNFPAADFMFKDANKIKEYDIPSTLLYELVEHENKNTINIKGNEVLFTDFQKRLWNDFNTENKLSVSAPTSAGKSFALQKFLVEQLLSGASKFILYLVPTRALLGQVADSISDDLSKFESNIPVITIPEASAALNLSSGVYVLTQERAHALLEIDKEIVFDNVIIDEAQTIGAGARGVLLQLVIEKLVERNANSKFFFGSPFSKNPTFFSCLFDEKVNEVKEVESPVAQNLIGAEISKEDPRLLSLLLYSDQQPMPLGQVKLEKDLNDQKVMFSYICYFLGNKAKNIIYAGSPSACEDIADKIRQWIDDDGKRPKEVPEDVLEVAQFIREHIHPKYALADMIERGVAFHYGKMPAILRNAIEKHFSYHPHMQFLVCTSTLLHGVNLPAKNLFLLKPSEGKRWLASNAESISSPSFWNLAGRAGRLGKDFEGNVFLVNKQDWELDPLTGEREQSINSSFYEALKSQQDSILKLARKEVEVLASDKDGETGASAFVKLYSDFKKGNLDRTFGRAPEAVDQQFKDALVDAFQNLSFSVPDEIIENNIGISPHRQEQMLQYLFKNIKKKNIDKLIPLHPEADAYDNYVRMFNRFEIKFGGKKAPSRASERLAAIALAWMRGTSYPIMISKQEEYSKTDNLPKTIRDTMETIETVIRFKLVRETKCYIDLLKYALILHELRERAERIPAIPLFLEVGASSGTMISLVGMGFTRTTAALINQKAADRSMDRAKCLSWLKRENWEASDLPKISKSEIKNIIGF